MFNFIFKIKIFYVNVPEPGENLFDLKLIIIKNVEKNTFPNPLSEISTFRLGFFGFFWVFLGFLG